MENSGDVLLMEQGVKAKFNSHFIVTLGYCNFKHVIKALAVVIVNQLQGFMFSHEQTPLFSTLGETYGDYSPKITKKQDGVRV